jgi:hypothetical protein
MKKYLLIIVLAISMIEMANGQIIRYVTTTGAGSNNGTSWEDAYDNTQLQTAINETAVTQVWVAAGTYKPTSGNERNISFQMKNDVAYYGGFSGTETLLSQSNWKPHVSILRGDDVVAESSATVQ